MSDVNLHYFSVAAQRARGNVGFRWTQEQQEHADRTGSAGMNNMTIKSIHTDMPEVKTYAPSATSENLPSYDGAGANLSYGSFRDKLAKGAIYEYEQWNKGKLKEGDPRIHDRMVRYWTTVAGKEGAEKRTKDLETTPDSHHWSAAFISTMVKEAGGKDFKFHGMHSYFLTQAADNRKAGKGNYKGYKPKEVKIEVGDLVAYSRTGGITYDSRGSYAAHSDIVVAVHDGYIETIGGNLSDAVNKNIVKLDKQGHLASNKYHMVVKFNY